MRDYAELIHDLRCCSDVGTCNSCSREKDSNMERCDSIEREAADAIEELLVELTTIRKQLPRWISVEELLADSPPALWTDEPIEGTEFMTHTQGGGKGFEIHFRTDRLEKYKAVQDECRRQIGHAKPAPPEGVE